jgi:16S rRNA (adenine1518-N6/adenine1519-N6)-dimethyltransferase
MSDRLERPTGDGLLTPSDVSALLAESGLSAKRSLGQNFVVDPNTIRRIVRIAGVGPGDRVLEIGPGVGSLTRGLLAAGAEVTAIEKDEQVAEVLRSVVGSDARVVTDDALEVDLTSLLDGGDWVLVANLPYNVATQLVLRVLERQPRVQRMLVMVQREVGERLVAAPGSKAYGIPSLRLAQFATATLAGDVPAEVFRPRPRVRSVLVSVQRRAEPLVSVADDALLWRLVRAAFGQRRKTLRRSLDGLVSDEDFTTAGIATDERPEQLDLASFAALADAVHRREYG